MSLLDELAEGQIDYAHICVIETRYGKKPRNHERMLFAWEQEMGNTHLCVCGRAFKVVRFGGYPIWKDVSK